MDKKKIQEGVKLILEGIGENPDREGLLDTPDRIARMYEEIFGGLTQTAEEPLSKTFHVKDNAMVLEKDITFYSTCEHHFMPFYGKAHIAYIPDGKVVGLSKLARTVEVVYQAGSHASRVGALVCCLLSLLSSVLAHTMIYSPWVIYFSIIATQWLVRFIKMKRKSDLVLTVLFFVLSILAFVGFVSHLLEVRI